VAKIDDAAIVRMLHAIAARIEREKDHLCELDSAVGDGDHGVSMTIGMRAIRRNLDDLEDPTAGEAFRAAAEAFADDVGAAIGPIYEELLSAAGATLDEHDAYDEPATWAAVFEAIAAAAQRTGGAKPGDKTMVDAWVPAAAALREAADEGTDLATALDRAVEAAWGGVQATKDLVPKLGRASRLGERARGHPDAGATSSSIVMEEIRDALTGTAA
jgi:dihydroxyacetone kinase-like protein